jgi:ribosomal protein S18 acetylase RimI-like enzyme
MFKIIFKDETSDLSKFEDSGFFVGWNCKPKVDLKTILSKSTYFVVAVDGQKIVGFVTCNSDTYVSAYIPLLEVLPEYKNQKIGTKLMQKMLEKVQDMYMIDIICDVEMNSFYAKFNFNPYNSCIIRNKYKN